MDNEQGDEGSEEDRPQTNPLRLHGFVRNQRESVAHFVSGRAFLPTRNERTVRQQHHRPRLGVPPPSGFFCFQSRRKMKDYRHCFRFLLGHLYVPGEIANNNYAKLKGCIMGFVQVENIMFFITKTNQDKATFL